MNHVYWINLWYKARLKYTIQNAIINRPFFSNFFGRAFRALSSYFHRARQINREPGKTSPKQGKSCGWAGAKKLNYNNVIHPHTLQWPETLKKRLFQKCLAQTDRSTNIAGCSLVSTTKNADLKMSPYTWSPYFFIFSGSKKIIRKNATTQWKKVSFSINNVIQKGWFQT